MTTTITTTTTTTTTTTNNTNDANDAQEPQPPTKRKERRPKWMRAPTPFEKQRGARLILEAAGLLRPRHRVVAVADGASSVAEVEAAVAAVALVVAEEEEEEDEERAAWRAMIALNRRLRAPPVVAAICRLFPALVAQARRQAPDTMATDGVKYDMTALPDAFVLAQHNTFITMLIMKRPLFPSRYV
jgi:hypothetical protein